MIKKFCSNNELNNILLKHIPDSKNDFGSWRGYSVFGLDENIYELKYWLMIKELKNKTINDKKPLVMHKLYEPTGFMTKNEQILEK